MNTEFLNIAVVVIATIFIIIKLLLGVCYIVKFPKKVIDYKLSNTKKYYNITDEMRYLSVVGLNNLLVGGIILGVFVVSFFIKTDINSILAIVIIFVFFFIQRKERSYLKRKF